jgi:carbon-monoxide dehydrogenase medium subunit
MSFRLARPTVLVDLNFAKGLADVREDEGVLEVGAMVRQRHLERNQPASAAVPLLPMALSHVGHVTNRNRGTIGGSVAHADPAAELPTLVQALGGEMVVRGPSGTRTLPSHDFFQGTFTTAMAFDDVLVAVRLPRLPAGTGVDVQELARRRGDFAVVGALAAIHLDSEGRIDLVRLAVSGVAPVPARLHKSEEYLMGAPTRGAGGDSVALEDATVDAAVEATSTAIDPTDDIHASAAYRRDMTQVLVRRAIKTAVHRASEAIR